jgi:hypothetical protein
MIPMRLMLDCENPAVPNDSAVGVVNAASRRYLSHRDA